MNKQQAKELLGRYELGQCSADEQTLLEQWYIQEAAQQQLPIENLDYAHMKQRIWKGIRQPKHGLNSWIIAAAALFLISAVAYVIRPEKFAQKETIKSEIADVAPGKNTATLTLADGRKIILSEAMNGQLAKVSGVIISKTNDGQVIYHVTAPSLNIHLTPKKKEELNYNMLSTARGETYQIRLPDGTDVWLNAASSLKYPVSFTTEPERRVELNGEAYFEVSKDKKRPFIVKTNNQAVEVLGTHFNINTYNEEVTKTTLLEGSVKLVTKNLGHTVQTTVLKPGDQSVYSDHNLVIKQVDPDLEIAWKKGKTEFEDADLKTVMGMLERWYNIEAVYQGKLTASRFSGSVSRSKNISEILRLLETTKEVHFKINGRRIIVMN